jgi:hypothetical protein
MFDENAMGGVLGGAGMDEIGKLSDKIDPSGQGWIFECHCQRCGQEAQVIVSWPELIQASERLVPVDQHGTAWRMHEGKLFPPAYCACNAGTPLPVFLVPDKAMRCVRAGLSAGVISQQQVTSLVSQIRARHGGR